MRGPASVLHGSDALGGVINIRTRSALPRVGFGFGGRLGATALPNADGRRTHAEASVGNRWFSARLFGSVGALNNYRTPDSTVFFSGVDENSASGEMRLYPTPEQSLSFKFLHRGGYNFGLPSLDPDPAFLAEFPYSKLNKYSGAYQKSFGSRALSSIQVRAYTQQQDRAFLNTIAAGRGVEIVSDTVTHIESSGLDLQATSMPN